MEKIDYDTMLEDNKNIDPEDNETTKKLLISLGKGCTNLSDIITESRNIKNQEFRVAVLEGVLKNGYRDLDNMMKELKELTYEWGKARILAQMIYERLYSDFNAIMEEIRSWNSPSCKEHVLRALLIDNIGFNPIMKEINKWKDESEREGDNTFYNGNVYFDAIMREVKTWTEEAAKSTILSLMIARGYNDFSAISEEIETWEDRDCVEKILQEMKKNGYSSFKK